MPRSLSCFAGCAMALVFCLPGYAQDSPSLADIARQAQKDKGNAQAKKVITNDDLPSGSVKGSSGYAGGLGTGLGQVGQPASHGKQDTPASPADALNRLESVLDQVAELDRATLVKNVLQGGDTDFPGRAAWEDRLVAARGAFVSQGRAFLQKARQIESSLEGLKGIQDPNDPRVKDMTSRLQQFVEEGSRMSAAFQAVMMEGRDLAAQSSHH